jgi:hypothetical protein
VRVLAREHRSAIHIPVLISRLPTVLASAVCDNRDGCVAMRDAGRSRMAIVIVNARRGQRGLTCEEL